MDDPNNNPAATPDPSVGGGDVPQPVTPAVPAEEPTAAPADPTVAPADGDATSGGDPAPAEPAA